MQASALQAPLLPPITIPVVPACTVFVVPDRGSRIQRLSLEAAHVAILSRLVRLKGEQIKRIAWISGSVVCLLVAMVIGLAWHCVASFRSGDDRAQLQSENQKLQEQLAAIRDRVARINETLGQVKQLDGVALAAPIEGKSDASTQGLDGLATEAESQEKAFGDVAAYFQTQKSELDATPATWPARGWVTSDFGTRLDPWTAEKRMHAGLDIANAKGTPILAPADGIVETAANESGYGKAVVLDHGNGITTRYGHLSRIDVHPGEHVSRGQVIARMGSSGRSTGPHLHYEVRANGVPQNPRQFLLDQAGTN